MAAKGKMIGRIALREEGDKWVAYYAMPDTMDGALFLASTVIGPVKKSYELKQKFMGFARSLVSEMIETETGEPVEWDDPKPAPEHEKAGRA